MLQGRKIALRLTVPAEEQAIRKIATECKEWLFWDQGQLSLDNLFEVLLATQPGTYCRMWSVLREEKIIGFITLNHIEAVHKNAEIGYVGLLQEYKSPWIMADMVKTVLRFGFTTLDLHRVYGRVYSHHKALNTLYKHLRFNLEGTQREALRINGTWADMNNYAMLQTEWKAKCQSISVNS